MSRDEWAASAAAITKEMRGTVGLLLLSARNLDEVGLADQADAIRGIAGDLELHADTLEREAAR